MWTSSNAIALFVSVVAAQTISNVLREQNGLKTFTSYISQFPNLLEKLDSGNFTGLLLCYVKRELKLTASSPCSYRRCFCLSL